MKTIPELMAELAQQSAVCRPNGGTLYGDPCAELVDAVADPATGSTRVRFVFDFMVRQGTLSGSDTYYHHVFVATAELRAGRVVASHIEPRREVYVSEYDVEWAPSGRRYDPDVLRRDVGEQWRREFQPTPASAREQESERFNAIAAEHRERDPLVCIGLPRTDPRCDQSPEGGATAAANRQADRAG